MESLPSFGKFYQLGYVTRDVERGAEHMIKVMGARQLDLTKDFKNRDGSPSIACGMAHLDLAGIQLELIQPTLDWPSPLYLEALPDTGTAVTFHHMGFRVESEEEFDQSMERIKALNFAVPFSLEAPTFRMAYIDSRAKTGHYCEIVLYRKPHA